MSSTICVRFLQRSRGMRLAGHPIVFFPFVIGMAYFIPLDLSFTFWFFYIFWKFEMIFGSIAGLQRIPGFPFIFDQSFGVCVGVLLMALWSARHHLRNVSQASVAHERKSAIRRTDVLSRCGVRIDQRISATDRFLVGRRDVSLGRSPGPCDPPDNGDGHYPRPRRIGTYLFTIYALWDLMSYFLRCSGCADLAGRISHCFRSYSVSIAPTAGIPCRIN